MQVRYLSGVVISYLCYVVLVFTIDAFHILFVIKLHLLDLRLQFLDLPAGIFTQSFDLVLKVLYLLSQRRNCCIQL
jgi:hypothetical protein